MIGTELGKQFEKMKHSAAFIEPDEPFRQLLAAFELAISQRDRYHREMHDHKNPLSLCPRKDLDDATLLKVLVPK